MYRQVRLFLRVLRITGLLCLLSVDAVADPSVTGEAKAAFGRGVEAYAARMPKAAAEHFWEAFELAPTAAAAFNAGVGWKDARIPAKAAMAFDAALRVGGLKKEQREEAVADLRILMRSVSKVRIEAPGRGVIDVGEVEGGHSPVVTFLPHGDYLVRVKYPNGQEQSRLIEAREPAHVVRFALPNQRAMVPRGDAKAGNAEAPFDIDRSEAADSRSGPWVWVAFGAATASAGVAIWAGTRALSARDDYYDSGFRDAAARDRAASYRTWTNVAWGAAGVGAGVGVYLLVTDWPVSTKANARSVRTGIYPALNHVSFVAQF